MSKTAIMDLQRGLALLGYDPGKVDGIRGPKTSAALNGLAAAWNAPLVLLPRVVDPDPPEMAGDGPALPADSIAKLAGVHPVLTKLITDALATSPIKYHVIEGVRTKARQAQLVAQKASKTMNSRHLDGHAVDLWPIDPATGRRAESDDKLLWQLLPQIASAVKNLAASRGIALEWGGDWGWDAPHFQLSRKAYPSRKADP